jgi:hypothetical protein
MEERRGKMDRKKFGAVLIALLTGLLLSTGSALAQSGYLIGDPATGKLIPFYRIGASLATIIGFTSTEGNRFGPNASEGDVAVHATVFNRRSAEITNFDLCLSPSDFGFIVLQQNSPTAGQIAELSHRFAKARVLSASDLTLNGVVQEIGYVTLTIIAEFESHNGKCSGSLEDSVEYIPSLSFSDAVSLLTSHDNEEHLATWAILADVGQGFFATEIPTPTANINPDTGAAVGGIGAYGLIPGPPLDSAANHPDDPDLNGCANSNDEFPCVLPNTPDRHGSTVIARFDVNPAVDSHTQIFVWLQRNANPVAGDPGSGVTRSGSVTAFLDCEDEFRQSTVVPLPDELNIIDPDILPGIGQCKFLNQFRGNLLFDMPDTGFLWSQITQETDHFRQNYIGYNLGDNDFIDCADGFNDFINGFNTSFDEGNNSAPPLCSGNQ